MLKRVLSKEDFVYYKEGIFKRMKNEVPQAISFEKKRLWDSIWFQVYSNQNTTPYYTDDLYISEYFFTSEEDFYRQLDVVEQEFKGKWISSLNRKTEEYNITASLMKKYNEKTDEYVQKVLGNHSFPETIDELIDIVKGLYHGKEEFNREQKDEAICMTASLYWEYIIRNYPEYKPFCGKSHPKKLTNLPHCTIPPLRVAFSSFMTDDYDEFKSGTRIWDVEENSTWVKKEEWEQKIF